jgi:uncharacterized membrane protein YdbT with pleckstrin-like domain
MEERIWYQSHPAMFRARPFLFILFALLTAALGLGLILLAVWWVRTRRVTLTVTGRCVRLQTGIWSRHIVEVRHRDVREVAIDQGGFERLTNVGTIGISTAAGPGVEIVARGMPEPMKVKDLINQFRPESWAAGESPV